MSSIPNNDRDLLRGILGTKWNPNYDNDREREAARRLLQAYPELRETLRDVEDRYMRHTMKRAGHTSWRDWREYNARDLVDRRHDIDDILDRFDERYHIASVC